MAGKILLSLLLFCQGLLFISGAYTGKVDDVKVQETDWVDISADLADVDDNTLDSNQGIDVMLEDFQPSDDDDGDDDDGDDVLNFEDDSATLTNKDIPENNFLLETQSRDVSANFVCLPIPVTVLNLAVCHVGVPLFESYANKAKIPNFRWRRFQLKNIDISGTEVGSCSVTGGSSKKTLKISGLKTEVKGKYRYKLGIVFKGSVRVRVSGVSVQISFNHRTLSNGCVTFSNLKCSSSIRSVKVKARGGLVGLIINIFKKRIGRKLKGRLNGKICTAAIKFLKKGSSGIFQRG